MKKETLLKTIIVTIIFAMATSVNAQTWQLKCDLASLNSQSVQSNWYALNVYKFDFKSSNENEGLVIRRDSIRTTANGGQSWANANMLPKGGNVGNFKTDAIGYTNNGNTIFSSVYQKIHKSTDGGVTFNVVTDTLQGEPKAFSSSGNFLMFGYTGCRVAYSNDGGNTWIQKTLENISSAIQWIHVLSENVALASTASSSYYTKDGGSTWVQVTKPASVSTVAETRFTGVDENNWYCWFNGAGNTDALLKTSDGGLTWTDIIANVGTFNIADVRATSTGKLFAALSSGDRPKYKYSTDNGQTFTEVNINNSDTAEIEGFRQIGSTLYALVLGSNVWKIYALDLGGSVGITENEIVNQLNVFPNPANNFVTITNLPANSIIRLTDVSGKLIYTSKVADEQTVIGTENFGSGVYFISVESNGNVVNRKLVINK